MNYGYQHALHVIDWRLWLAIVLHVEPRFVYSRKGTFADLDGEEEQDGRWR